jgi:Ca2+-binding RTX toxin-like protein
MANFVSFQSINFTAFPDVDGGDLQDLTTSGFTQESTAFPGEFMEITGEFVLDGSGDIASGIVTGFAWIGVTYDFQVTGLNLDVNAPTAPSVVDGVTLTPTEAELAWWLSGADSITGSTQNDTLKGYAGNDTVNGGDGSDRLEGWSGDDVLDGGSGSDTLSGGAGNDTLIGGDSNDRLSGDAGDDSVSGGAGSDVLLGGSNAGNDTLDGGVVTDRINFFDSNTVSYASETAGVTVDLTGITGDGSVGSGLATSSSIGIDVLRNVNLVQGGSGNDIITGSGASIFEQIEGGAGDDVLSGGGGSAADNRVSYAGASSGVNVNFSTGRASGGAGSDTISGFANVAASAYNDTLTGSNRTDVTETYRAAGGNDYIDGQGGFDLVRFDAEPSGAIDANLVTGLATNATAGTVDTLVGIEGLWGTGLADTLTGGNTLNGANYYETGKQEVFRGAAGNDTIDGGVGFDRADYINSNTGVVVDLSAGTASDGFGNTDTLINIEGVRGSSYNDSIRGSDTDTFDVDGHFDYLEGGAGNDTLDGGGGADVVSYVNSTGGVTVNLQTGTASDGMGGTDTLFNFEAIRGSNFNDILTGINGDTRVFGFDGNDSIAGGDGDDVLDGGAGNDTLFGHAGNDSLVGGAGGDVFWAGAGNDTIDGGAILDRTNFSDLNTLNYSNATSQVIVDMSGITGDGSQGEGTATGADIGNDLFGDINSVVTGSGNDSILGSSAAIFEVFNGGAGNDTIDGGALVDPAQLGTNRVNYGTMAGGVNVTLGSNGFGTATGANTGTDILRNIHAVYGTSGNDSITGSDDNTYTEQFSGRQGNDLIDGRGGFDILRADASAGNLTVNLVTGRFTSSDSQEGVDTLIGIEGVFAGNGNDSLVGGNTLNGANFTDNRLEVFRGGGGNDTINGGVGIDRIDYNSSGVGVAVNLGTGAASDGFGGVDTFSNIEGIRGSEFDDTLTGTDRATADGYFEFFEGRGGNDTIDGKGGYDRVDYHFATGGINVNLGSSTASNDGTGGADTLLNIEGVRGSAFNDAITGSIANNRLDGGAGNDQLNGGDGSDTLNGDEGHDNLAGGAGSDVISGGAGNDVVQGGGGNDTLDGGTITDRVSFSDGNTLSYAGDTLGVNINLSGITGDGSVGSGTVTARSSLTGNAGTDVVRNFSFIVGGSGADSILGSSASIFEQFVGGLGNDTIDGGAISADGTSNNRATYVNETAAVVVSLGGNANASGTATGTTIGTDTLFNINQVRGSAFADSITGSDRTDVTESFEGRAGDDTIDGEGGFDIVRFDLSNPTSGVTVTLNAGEGEGVAVSAEGTDVLRNIEGVNGTSFADSLTGGGTSLDYSDTTVFELFRGLGGNDTINGGAGFDRADYSTDATGVDVDLQSGEAADGFGDVDTLINIEGVIGSAFNDTLQGSDRDTFGTDGYLETFIGNRGNDFIDGRGGIDVVVYQGSTAGVKVNLGTGQADDGMGGNDTLSSIEVVVGSNFADTLIGSSGDNRLDGRGGADSMAGGGGNDRYIVDVFTDVVTELANEGVDRVDLNVTAGGAYTLTANVENAYVTPGTAGSTLAVNVTGNALYNQIVGNAGNNSLSGLDGSDTLDGGAGNDTLVGGADNDTLIGGEGNDSLVGGNGDDRYTIDAAGDVVVETTLAGSGSSDTVNVVGSASFTYTMGVGVENVQLAGSTGTVHVTGNAANNFIQGNAASQTLSGGAGDDWITSGGGNDTIDGGVQTATGKDTAEVRGALGDYDVQRLVNGDVILTGKAESTAPGVAGSVVTLKNVEQVYFWDADVMYSLSEVAAGNVSAFDDIVDMADLGGQDTLDALAGNDTVIGTEGNDTIKGSAGNDNLDGSGGDDSLEGGEGNDTLNGDGDNDTMVGGLGNDTYVLGATGTIVESGGTLGGVDSVRTWATEFSLETLTNVENLTYTGDAAFTGTGNAAINRIEGSTGNDTLDGKGGIDTLVGGAGNDTYVLGAGDVIIELAEGGTDTVQVAASYTLGVDLENAVATGTAAINLTGNAGNNELTGNTANNSLSGGAGDDTFYVTTGNDTIDGGANEGDGGDTAVFTGAKSGWTVEKIASGVKISKAGTNVTLQGVELFEFVDGETTEAFTLSELLNNSISEFPDDWRGDYPDDTPTNDSKNGLGGNDTLDGREGDDTLFGGAGNDSLVGGNGADVLDGEAGVDVADGGAGDDTYYVGVAGDSILEAPGGGLDTVRVAFSATGTYVMSNTQELENGTIISALSGVNLTGNDLANSLVGGDGNNVLTGNLGNDTLDGGLGSDTLVGGNGDDVYHLNVSTDVVTETNSDSVTGGEDEVRLQFAASAAYVMTANVENATVVASSGVNVTVTGTLGSNDIIGHAGSNVLNGGAGDDVLEGGGGNDTLDGGTGSDYVVLEGLLSDYTVTRDSATLTRFTHDSGYAVLMSNVEWLEFAGDDSTRSFASVIAQIGSSGNDSLAGDGDGNALDGGLGNDLLAGNGGNDSLSGGVGADTLRGGAGDDTLLGGAGADTYVFGYGQGTDLLSENDTVAGVVDAVQIEADSGNIAGGEVQLVRASDDATDVLVRVYGQNDSYAELRIDGFFTATDTVGAGAIEQIRFADGGVVLTQAQILQELLKGTGSGDFIRGFGTNDLINGLDGDDELFGAAGNDTLIGNWGIDLVDGGAGADQLFGNLGMDTLVGGAGNDILDGGADNDTLAGGSDNDVLLGGLGDDTLDGGAGSDTLTGGAGSDVLDGGSDSNADRFVLNNLDGTDTLLNFDAADSDKIAISKSVFSATDSALNATGASLDDLGDAWQYHAGTGELRYDADGFGTGDEHLVVARFDDVPAALTGNIFLVV